MNILVTGATGFVGNAVLKYNEDILRNKNEIILLSSHAVKGYKTIIHHDFSFDKNDLPNNIDYLLCIQGYVPKTADQMKNSYLHALAVSGMKSLLDQLPCVPKRIVYCSSVDVYGRSNGNKIISENDQSFVYDYYSAQKLMCEGILEEYAKVNQARINILRLGPLFGEKDLRRESFLPGIIYKAAAGEQITLTANPMTKRNYLYVKDCAKAIWTALLKKDDIPPVINVVSCRNTTMEEIIRTAIKVTNSKSRLLITPSGDSTAGQMMFDSTFMRRYLCCEDYSLESAMTETFNSIRGEA